MQILGRLNGGTLIYVNPNGLFLGIGSMTPIAIKHIEDDEEKGITRIYTTSNRTLIWPKPDNQDFVARWGTHRVFPLEPSDFEIIETTPGKVTITRK